MREKDSVRGYTLEEEIEQAGKGLIEEGLPGKFLSKSEGVDERYDIRADKWERARMQADASRVKREKMIRGARGEEEAKEDKTAGGKEGGEREE